MASLLEAGLDVTAIGMSVVFVLLTALVFIIKGMSTLALKLGGVPDSGSAAAGAARGQAQLPEHELVSVISAAVAMHRRRR